MNSDTETLETTLKAYCNSCGGERNCFVLKQHNVPWEHEDENFHLCGQDDYLTLKCCGCDEVFFRKQSWNSEDINIDGSPILYVEMYPPATARDTPEWLSIYDSPLDKYGPTGAYITSLLLEIYSALQSGSSRLVMMGIRALIEYIMLDKVGDHGTFSKNLSQFQNEGYIGNKQRDFLESTLDSGSATIHRGHKPSSADVKDCMDIVEGLIAITYLHPVAGERVSLNTPKRQVGENAGIDPSEINGDD